MVLNLVVLSKYIRVTDICDDSRTLQYKWQSSGKKHSSHISVNG